MLLGEADAGKVQHVVPEVTIPPEVTPENVTTSIVDTSCLSSSASLLVPLDTILHLLASMQDARDTSVQLTLQS